MKRAIVSAAVVAAFAVLALGVALGATASVDRATTGQTVKARAVPLASSGARANVVGEILVDVGKGLVSQGAQSVANSLLQRYGRPVLCKAPLPRALLDLVGCPRPQRFIGVGVTIYTQTPLELPGGQWVTYATPYRLSLALYCWAKGTPQSSHSKTSDVFYYRLSNGYWVNDAWVTATNLGSLTHC
jgi:hypothetical protein